LGSNDGGHTHHPSTGKKLAINIDNAFGGLGGTKENSCQTPKRVLTLPHEPLNHKDGSGAFAPPKGTG